MRAFFSKRNSNNTPSSDGPDGQRKRTTSSGSVLGRNGRDQNHPRSYAEPQDILYPTSALGGVNGGGAQGSSSQAYSRQGSEVGMGKGKRRSQPLLGMNADVGDAPTSSIPTGGGIAKRASKGVFDSLRGRPSFLATDRSEGGGEEIKRAYPPASTSKTTPASDDVPFFVVSPRSISSPGTRRHKPKEEAAKKDAAGLNAHGLDLAPLSAKTESFALSSPSSVRSPSPLPGQARGKADGDTTPRQNNISTFPIPSRPNNLYLEVAPVKAATRSAPTSPLLTTHSNSSPATTPSIKEARQEDTFSLKRSLRKRNGQSGSRLEAESEAVAEERPQTGLHPTSNSQDLASELNDLAVASQEGLLGEEEYRMLRQSVFEKMMGRGQMEIPREGTLKDRTVKGHGNGKGVVQDEKPASSFAPSMRSRQSSKSNLASLFRRGSKIEPSHSNHGASSSRYLQPSNSSLVSNGLAPSFRSKKSNSSAMEAQVYHARRARTIRGVQSQSAVDASSSSGHTPGGGMGSSIYSASALSMGGVSISSGNALLGSNYAEKGSEEIQAEIAVVEAEGRRILERFKSLQLNAIGRYDLEFEMMKRATSGVEGEGDLMDDFVMIDGQGTGAEFGVKQASRNGDVLGGLVRKTKSFGSLDAIASAAGSRKSKSKAESKAAPPSSYRGVASRTVTKVPSGVAVPPESDTVQDGNEDDEVEVGKLRAELAEIARRRNEVTKKYADRLAFLRSTLRSAKIREGLK